VAKPEWYTEPQADESCRFVRRDAEEQAAVAAALSLLRSDHPARVAFENGLDTIALTHLVADRQDLVNALKKAYLDGFGRGIGHGFRP
jgi:hypothetical protein